MNRLKQSKSNLFTCLSDTDESFKVEFFEFYILVSYFAAELSRERLLEANRFALVFLAGSTE